MPIFASKGYPDVDAAISHANLLAKTEYGAGGECTFIRLVATERSVLTFQASIGNFRGHGVTNGRDS